MSTAAHATAYRARLLAERNRWRQAGDDIEIYLNNITEDEE